MNESIIRENSLLARNEKLELKLQLREDAFLEELKAMRVRETTFINRILAQANVAPVPAPETVLEEAAVETLPATEDQLLQRRAADYCAATIGAEYTKEDYEGIYQAMKANPDKWLTD